MSRTTSEKGKPAIKPRHKSTTVKEQTMEGQVTSIEALRLSALGQFVPLLSGTGLW